MTEIITPADLPAEVASDGLAHVWIDGANAKASRVAPCLAGEGEEAPTDGQLAEARLVLVGAVRRWAEAGSGAYSQQTAGPFSVSTDTRQRTGYNLWPSEIEALEAICKTGGSSGAYSVDTAPGSGSAHLPWCTLLMGGTYCSCGADIAGEPIYELG